MIEEVNRKHQRQYVIALVTMVVITIAIFLLSLMVGQYGLMSPGDLYKAIANYCGAHYELPRSYENVVGLIRLPRTLAAFLVGAALSIAGLVYQNTFNNKLVSPDILGVSAGACVGAGIAILLNLGGALVSTFAFVVGFFAVILALLLPVFFKNRSNITLVLSGIIVGTFMNSIIGLLKFMADRDEKLAAITFWMMGSVSGITMTEVLSILPLIAIPIAVLLLMNHRIDVVSLGIEEAESLGINYKLNRLVIVVCSTILTAASISISGNIGWVGLVVPHIARALVGNRTKHSMPLALLFGGTFMMIVDTLSRSVAKEDIPLSIITGILGAIIYTVVLVKKGRNIND